MSTAPADGPARAGRYEIRVGGQLDQSWSGWFDGFTLTGEGDGTTTLTGPVVDQAALHGLLGRVRDLGVTLISVNALGAADVGEAGVQPDVSLAQ
ncbi:hypothetical protein [Mycetocola miduiensis]|uniref:Uncharacterized protein n=1 Tax=Mycetocola miduiensis TaxID=995034 RepID=A0A1I5C685_9MICO|nr:hypothetical protein [Mycetocola miduiensis]SFN82543.1 hypothetical protein SAMN05216219_2241 [Mycetocola miduiensis]